MTVGFSQNANNEKHVVKEYASVFSNYQEKKVFIVYAKKQNFFEHSSKSSADRKSNVMKVLNRLSEESWNVISNGNGIVYLLEIEKE